MRKYTLILIVVLALLLCACSGADTTVTDPATPDYIQIIRGELFDEDTALNQALSDAVSITLDRFDETSITVTVKAPNITEPLLAWFDGVSDAQYSDDALNAQMLTLLKQETQVTQFTLSVQDGEILYTDAFLNNTSCGIREFYAVLTARFMEEMEANANG